MEASNPWIDITKELPPKDGWYELGVPNSENISPYKSRWDGHFFYPVSHTLCTHWRRIEGLEKRYGKVHDDSSV